MISNTSTKNLAMKKKKLLDILRDYDMSRGEETEILTGCLYELHHKIKVSQKKAAESHSTLEEEVLWALIFDIWL